MISLNTIFFILCLVGLGLLVYSRYTSKPKGAKVSVRSAFTLLSSWAVFTLVESVYLVETIEAPFIGMLYYVVSALNVVFYIVAMTLSFFGYFDEKNSD